MKRFWKRSVCLMLTAALCLGILPIFGTAADSMEERQQALVAVAMAYYDKGHSMQYDNKTVVDDVPRRDGGKTRSDALAPPEYATPHNTLFSVCSTYMHDIYWDAFNFGLSGTPGTISTGGLSKIKEDDPRCVRRFDATTGADAVTAVEEMLTLAQPGDIFNVYNKKSEAGHAMMYVGDVKGDGKNYLAHCFGASMNPEKQRDNREYAPKSPLIDERYGVNKYADGCGGSIRLTEVGKQMLGYAKKGKQTYISLLRPLNAMSETEYPIPAKTRFRMTHPRFAVDRTLDRTRFGSYEKGETATLTLVLFNNSKTAYAVPVTEKIPAGVELKNTPSGATVAGDKITWNVQMPAGSEKTLTVEYIVTAERGTQLVFDGSSVGDIPATQIAVTVSGRKLNTKDLRKLDAIAKGKYNTALVGTPRAELGETVYRKILGLDITMPTMQQIADKLTEEKTFSDGGAARVLKGREKLTSEEKQVAAMVVPMFHGGRNLWNLYGHERMNDLRDMHVEPGDVILRTDNIRKPEKIDPLVYLGSGKYLMLNEQNQPEIVEEPTFFKSLFFSAFFGIRPALGYDDMHTLALQEKLLFADVKQSDWFYAFVKELVEDGTVSGMTATTFAPNGTLTYGQALKLIALAVGEKEPAKSGKHWASGYLALAKSKGWLTADVDPDAAITRLELCRIAAKAKNLTAQPASNPFADTADKDVLALHHAGVINGMTATEFAPEGLLTRAQIAKIICALRKL
ncbi:MAG: S-layer homology domain-containing protein [Oscillospiraceae bacterium]|nr:S-layer homology domain-containing protein [Oscillospiraceae bacterium]